MRWGIRKPSIKKRIAARTSPKRILRHNYGVKMPKGGGLLSDSKKASYNKIYKKGSKSIFEFIRKILGIKDRKK